MSEPIVSNMPPDPSTPLARTCRTCGMVEVRAEARFCGQCGGSLPDLARDEGGARPATRAAGSPEPETPPARRPDAGTGVHEDAASDRDRCRTGGGARGDAQPGPPAAVGREGLRMREMLSSGGGRIFRISNLELSDC